MPDDVDAIITGIGNVKQGNEVEIYCQEMSIHQNLFASQQQMMNYSIINIMQQSANKPSKNHYRYIFHIPSLVGKVIFA